MNPFLEIIDLVNREDRALEGVLSQLETLPLANQVAVLARAYKRLQEHEHDLLEESARRVANRPTNAAHVAEEDAEEVPMWRRVYLAMLENPGASNRLLAEIVYGRPDHEGRIRSQLWALKERGLVHNSAPGVWEAIRSPVTPTPEERMPG